MSDIITERIFPPDGLDPNDDEYGDFSLFSVWVVWKGKGQYAVQMGPGKWTRQLSRAGNWSRTAPEPFQRHQYRFTYDEACAWAEKVRGTLVINGRTWDQVQWWRASLEAASVAESKRLELFTHNIEDRKVTTKD